MTFENSDPTKLKDSLLRVGVKSTGITFVLEGSVELYYKNAASPFLIYDEAVYFGDIGYLFETRNFYKYRILEPEQNKRFKIFSIDKGYLDNILEAFPDFHSVLKIRALRR